MTMGQESETWKERRGRTWAVVIANTISLLALCFALNANCKNVESYDRLKADIELVKALNRFTDKIK